MKRLIPILAALCISGPALAASGPDVMKVSVGDLDLDSDRGAATALSRIRVAARRFCGAGNYAALMTRVRQEECWQGMTAKAVAKLGHPRVAALHRPAPPVSLATR